MGPPPPKKPLPSAPGTDEPSQDGAAPGGADPEGGAQVISLSNRAQCRDENARRAGELAMRHRDWLLCQMNSMCRNQADAEDLVQEAITRFVGAFRDRLLPDERACGAWLTTTAGNLFTDQCRRQRVRSEAVLDPSLKNELVSEPGPPSAYEAVSEERFSEAMQKLSRKCREVLLLLEKGHKYKDIACLLGLKLGAVSKRIHDARAKLKKQLNPDEPGED